MVTTSSPEDFFQGDTSFDSLATFRLESLRRKLISPARSSSCGLNDTDVVAGRDPLNSSVCSNPSSIPRHTPSSSPKVIPINTSSESSRLLGQMSLPTPPKPILRRTTNLPDTSPPTAVPSGERSERSHERGRAIQNLISPLHEIANFPAAAGTCSKLEEESSAAIVRRFVVRNLRRTGLGGRKDKKNLFKVGNVYPVIPRRLSWTSVRVEPRPPETEHWFCIDGVLEYFPFASDFGPLNISCAHKFIEMMREKINNPLTRDKHIILYTGNTDEQCTNCSFLLGCYMMFENQLSPQEAWMPFSCIHPSPFCGFRDATFSGGDFPISVLDCLEGLWRCTQVGIYSPTRFNPSQYDYYDSPRNGDLHIIVPGKFIAFKGPTATRMRGNGVYSHSPKDLLDIFSSLQVKAIVRLNVPEYDRDEFTKKNIEHYDLFFQDCTCPNDAVVQRWMEICDAQKGVIAVHCLAGLGRTGTLIALWIMREYHFTACEAIAALRIIRPGSIICAQQHYLKANEERMWTWGDGGMWKGSFQGLSLADSQEACIIAKQVRDGMYKRMAEKSRKGRHPSSCNLKSP